MISLATLAMIGWIPLILVSFSLISPRRAVITAYIVGWMFLPVVSWNLPGLPQYDKATATNLGVFFAVLLFDMRSVARFRPGAADLPMLVFVLCPLGTSLSNDLGIYDGIAGVWAQVVTWAVPWVIARTYFGSLQALRELAYGMFLGALVYVPLCLFEMVFGAILHLKLYGYYQHAPDQTIRADGSVRPMVFMQHGLMLAMWMGSSALAGLAVGRDTGPSRIPRTLRGLLAFGLVATTLLSRSVGASALMLLGIASWFSARSLRLVFPLVLLVGAIPTYMTLRATGALEVQDLTQGLASGMDLAGFSPAESADRLRSADVRFRTEDRLFAQMRQKPLFGVGSWDFNRYVDPETGEFTTVTTDGYWTIQLATRGVTGLAAWTAVMLLPVLLFVRRFPARTWRGPLVSIAAALALVILLYTVDCLMNANINPIYTLIAGGLASLPAMRTRPRAAESAAPPPLQAA